MSLVPKLYFCKSAVNPIANRFIPKRISSQACCFSYTSKNNVILIRIWMSNYTKRGRLNFIVAWHWALSYSVISLYRIWVSVFGKCNGNVSPRLQMVCSIQVGKSALSLETRCVFFREQWYVYNKEDVTLTPDRSFCSLKIWVGFHSAVIGKTYFGAVHASLAKDPRPKYRLRDLTNKTSGDFFPDATTGLSRHPWKCQKRIAMHGTYINDRRLT